MAGCGCGAQQAEALERQALQLLLLINGAMFVIELLAGWWAESTGLIADSLDMLADAGVYALSFYAVGKGVQQQASTARLSGLLQIAFGVGVLLEVGRRFVYGSEPVSLLMMLVGGLALLANVSCLLILARHRHGGVHMRASWIFSTNDVIANLGVMFSGGLVWLLDSRYPDLLVGAVIAAVVAWGGVRILKQARLSRRCA